jgi:glycosyltransferase involved in cell wall biosynthesis
MGGGEQYAGAIAEALATEHEVTLLTPERFDAGELQHRLGVDLRDVGQKEVAPDAVAVAVASGPYDAFVNTSFGSVVPNLAPIGLYVVHFPFEESSLRKTAGTLVRKVVNRDRDCSVRAVGGLGPATARGCPVVGPTLLHVRTPEPAMLTIEVQPLEAAQASVRVIVGRETVAQQVIVSAAQLEVPVPAGAPVLVYLLVDGIEDVRDGARPPLAVGRVGLAGTLAEASPSGIRHRLTPIDRRAHLTTYDRFVANSHYTQRWIQRRWGIDATVLHPLVRLRTPVASTAPVILSIGRFFDARSGHSKRQLEMVRAFRRIVAAGGSGWRLVLVGGCDPAHRDYAMAVKREAAGLPIDVRLNAPGDVLEEALARASIYWHAAGLGVDAERHPDRLEHFGIAPIEAMSAGAVPIVYSLGGPAEVVEPGVSGLHFSNENELVASTLSLIRDPAALAALQRGAIARAAEFGRDRFVRETLDVVEHVAAPRRAWST